MPVTPSLIASTTRKVVNLKKSSSGYVVKSTTNTLDPPVGAYLTLTEAQALMNLSANPVNNLTINVSK